MKELCYFEWLDTYQPIKNHLDQHASYDGTLFETFGDEITEVHATDPHLVWTLMDEDGTMWIAPGRHYVNRLGYFICAEPWNDESQQVTLEVPRWSVVDGAIHYSDGDPDDPTEAVPADEIVDLLNSEGMQRG
ncbi:hypothetical protein [Sphingomonas jaspsi]|uniref:hypothetical protein n=1 Tax=Sphingomonas jaspsi TaxID=392409 RepID=UPI0004B713F9|nr:hypothetical protein [Sphingomonas jaspsi]